MKNAVISSQAVHFSCQFTKTQTTQGINLECSISADNKIPEILFLLRFMKLSSLLSSTVLTFKIQTAV